MTSPMPLALPVDSNERVLPMAPFASRKKWMRGLAEVPMRCTVAVERTVRSVETRGTATAASSHEVTPKFR
jgi:hypothetical protein